MVGATHEGLQYLHQLNPSRLNSFGAPGTRIALNLQELGLMVELNRLMMRGRLTQPQAPTSSTLGTITLPARLLARII